MSESQQALMLEEGSDESDQQTQMPQRNRLAPVAMVVAIVLAVSLALFSGFVGPRMPVASDPSDLLGAAESSPVEETPEKRAKEAIAELDKDKDGTISLKEWVGDDAIFNAKGPEYEEVKKEFDGIDKDTSGKLDLSEMTAFENHPQDHPQETPEQMAKQRLADLDQDKDGMLTLEEFVDDAAIFSDKTGDEFKDKKQQFDGLDRDGNGKLDADEYVKAFQSDHPHHGGGQQHPGHGGGPQYVEEEPSVLPDGCERSVAHPGAKLVKTEEKCREAAQKLGKKFLKSGSWKNGFGGCMVQFLRPRQQQEMVVFNRNMDDDATKEITYKVDPAEKEYYKQVCVVEPEPHHDMPPDAPP